MRQFFVIAVALFVLGANVKADTNVVVKSLFAFEVQPRSTNQAPARTLSTSTNTSASSTSGTTSLKTAQANSYDRKLQLIVSKIDLQQAHMDGPFVGMTHPSVVAILDLFNPFSPFDPEYPDGLLQTPSTFAGQMMVIPISTDPAKREPGGIGF